MHDGMLEITGDDFHHLTRVRRVSTGEVLDVTIDGNQPAAACIRSIEKKKILAEIIERGKEEQDRVPDRESLLRVHLYLSLLKGGNFDLALKKAVETGVTEITPVITERTVPRIDKDARRKFQRWQRIVEEAAKQSYRREIPVLHEITGMNELPAVDTGSDDVCALIAHLKGGQPLRRVLRESRACDFYLLVGPEGGFTEDEVDRASNRGWQPVFYGFSQLRAETAAIVLPAMIIYEKG